MQPVVARARGATTAVRGAIMGHWPVLLAFVAGFLLRLAVIPSSQSLDVAPLVADEGNYVGIAESLAAGGGIPDRWVWLRPPGYPLFVAAFLRLYDGTLRAPMVAQAVAGVVTILAAALIAGQLWGPRAAAVAAWWAALDPSLIYYTRILHTEALYTALLALAAAALVRYAMPGATWRWLVAAGGAIGLAALCRPTIAAILPFLALWVALRRWRGDRVTGLRHAILLLGLVAAIIAPNAIRNWRAYHRVIPLDTTLGYIFWLDHRDVSKEEILATLGAIPNPGDRQARALREGLAWVRAHPRETVSASVANLRIIWGDAVYVADAVGRRRGVADGWRYTVEALCLLNWVVLLPLAIAGARRARRFDPLVPLASIAILGPAIGVGLSHPENRYMLPSLPIFAALAAGCFAARALTVTSRRRNLAALAAVAIFLLNCWLIAAPEGRQRFAIAGHWLIGRAAERAGAPNIARGQFEAMLTWDGRLSEPDERKAFLAHAAGDDDAALALAQRAVERDPDNFRARILAAEIFRARGQLAEARRLATRATTTTPDALDWIWARTDGRSAPRSVTLDGTDIGFARGFYGAEQGDGGRNFRWSRDQAELRLAPPGADARTLILTLASPRAAGEPPLRVAVRANGRDLGMVVVRRELGWNTISVALPADLGNDQPLTIELRTETVRFPGDRRALGVAVAAVALATGSARDERDDTGYAIGYHHRRVSGEAPRADFAIWKEELWTARNC